ncbi:hypothetical protein CLU79DRAFT_753335 [Phycomyces nitens]|nr:hypothetical protein CLU79DRAFT_753335 [Phycomyces nitens]
MRVSEKSFEMMEHGQYLAGVVLVKGVPFYGYHVGHQTYLKVHLLNPGDKQRMTELLRSGAIMNTEYQLHEAHVSFELQFLMDYNLYGMNLIHLHPTISVSQNDNASLNMIQLSLRFRLPMLPSPESQTLASGEIDIPEPTLYTPQNVPSHLQWDVHKRTSYCELEIDTTVMSIANRLQVKERDIHTSLSKEREMLDTLSKRAQDPLVKSLNGLWLDEKSRRASRNIFEPILPLSQTEKRMAHEHWASEKRLREMMEHVSEDQEPKQVSNDFPGILTTFQAVEAFYPPEYYQINNLIPIDQNVLPESFSSIDHVLPQEDHEEAINDPKPLFSQETSFYNISQEPLVYSQLSQNTHLEVDQEIIGELMESQIFIDNELNEAELIAMAELAEMEENMNQSSIDEYDGGIFDEEFLKLVDEAENSPEMNISRHVDIGYDSNEDESTMLQAMDIQEYSQAPLSQNSRETPPERDTNTEAVELNISQLPPSQVNFFKTKKRRIPQNDGSSDIPDPDTQIDYDALWQKTKRHTLGRKLLSTDHSENVHRIVKRVRSVRILVNPKLEKSFQDFLKESRQPKICDSIEQDYRQSYKATSLDLPNDSIPQSQMSNSDRSLALSKPDSIHSSSKESQEINHSQITEGSLVLSQPSSTLGEVANNQIDAHSSPTDINPFNIPEPTLHSPKPVTRTVSNLSQDNSFKEYRYNHPPPLISQNIDKVYQKPFYSNPDDVPIHPKTFAGKTFKLSSKSIQHLKEFDPSPDTNTCFLDEGNDMDWRQSKITSWSPSAPPPDLNEVEDWLDQEKLKKTAKKQTNCPIEAQVALQAEDSLNENSVIFKANVTKPNTKGVQERDNLDLFSLEIHVDSRDQLLPDPSEDKVNMVFWALETDDIGAAGNSRSNDLIGIITVDRTPISKIGIKGIKVDYVEDEESIFRTLIERVRQYDPDILVGYELNNSSWGYLIERAAENGMNLVNELSRVQQESNVIARDSWGYKKSSVFRVTGRHMINVWRLMKGELSFTSYTFESIAFHLLHIRTPYYSNQTLTSWNKRYLPILKYRLYRYYLDRVKMNLDILDVSGIIKRTSESARIFGIDFYSVLVRGSQFRVESIMFRIAKPENYVLLTPSRKQVGEQRAIECLPLNLEPETKYYDSPVVVLDFQSLYPSIMIAYNYCYSTCLGRVRGPGDDTTFGVSKLDIQKELLEALKDNIIVSPNGVMYVDHSIRKGLLGKMLEDILSTRVMVKKSAKDYLDDKGLLRMLDIRQLTLKLIANVTYGYTSASYSGRMPAVDIADSIVQTGRETMERTIKYINEHPTWGGRVVYGDTDSVFINFPGKTRSEAFALGYEISEQITKMNPAPIKLKFEKVYHPCVLLAKKRYVGSKYESPTQEPEFEAKGIETVRRDGTAATQKILKTSLKILFKSQDMSQIKDYLYRQWTKILANRVCLQDFIIAKAVRLGTYTEQSLPPGAQVAYKRMEQDPRSEPQYGHRVPYVVIYRDGINAKLNEQAVHPEELLSDNSLRLNAEYYIRKQIIPPLSRVFSLVGVDIKSWYDDMPRSQKAMALSLSQHFGNETRRVRRIDQYYTSSHCIICRNITHQPICPSCLKQTSESIYTLVSRQKEAQKKWNEISLICNSCSHITPILSSPNEPNNTDHPCTSLDCRVFYERIKAKDDVHALSMYDTLIDQWPVSDT